MGSRLQYASVADKPRQHSACTPPLLLILQHADMMIVTMVTTGPAACAGSGLVAAEAAGGGEAAALDVSLQEGCGLITQHGILTEAVGNYGSLCCVAS